MTYIDLREQSREWANKLGNQSAEKQPSGDSNPVEDAENVLNQTSLFTPLLRLQVVRLRIRKNYITIICKVVKLKNRVAINLCV